MKLRRLLAPLIACVLLSAAAPLHAQDETGETLLDRLRELEASRQAVIMPLNGALDPIEEAQPEPPPAPETPAVETLPQNDADSLATPPLEGEAPGADSPLNTAVEPSLADAAVQTLPDDGAMDGTPDAEPVIDVPVAAEDDAAAAMLPDLDSIDGVVVAELGNPDSIGPYRLWLASFRTVREAQAGWQQLAKDNRDVLGDLLPVIVMKELGGDSGTFFRLQAGPLADEAQAQARCETLKSRTLYCAILGPEGG